MTTYARAHTNIALIKCWGKANKQLMLPATSSISLTLNDFYTDTAVTFDPALDQDQFTLNHQMQSPTAVAAFWIMFGTWPKLIHALGQLVESCTDCCRFGQFGFCVCGTGTGYKSRGWPKFNPYRFVTVGTSRLRVGHPFNLWRSGNLARGSDDRSSFAEPLTITADSAAADVGRHGFRSEKGSELPHRHGQHGCDQPLLPGIGTIE